LYRIARHIRYLQPIMPHSLQYNIHFNVGGSTAGQRSEVTAIAIQPPSPHFFESPLQYSTSPDIQALTKHSSRKSIKLSLGSPPLPFPLAGATHAIRAPLHMQHIITPSH